MTPAPVRLLERATALWFAVVTYAAVCTASGKTSPGLWLAPCAIATAYLAAAALLAERAVRKRGRG